MYALIKPKKKPKTVSTLPIPEYLTVLDIPLFIINIIPHGRYNHRTIIKFINKNLIINSTTAPLKKISTNCISIFSLHRKTNIMFKINFVRKFNSIEFY